MSKDDILGIIWLLSIVAIFVTTLCFGIFSSNNFDVENAVKENNKLKLEFYKETGKTYYKDYSEFLENKLNKGK